MISTFNTPSKGNRLSEEEVKNILKAVEPSTEIAYIQIFDRNEWDQEKEEWVVTDVSVHIKIGQTEMSVE